jgi:hypothetical protein
MMLVKLRDGWDAERGRPKYQVVEVDEIIIEVEGGKFHIKPEGSSLEVRSGGGFYVAVTPEVSNVVVVHCLQYEESRELRRKK